MNKKIIKKILSILFVVVIIVVIVVIEKGRAVTDNAPIDVIELSQESVDEQDVIPAKEIIDPTGFINIDDPENFKLANFIGDKVILVDFWTYSCINCQRTLPFLNAWHEAYADEGLLIVGLHRPEFEFEKDIENVKAAVEKWEIGYPVVLDNNAATWRAYENRYWPRKYLIDINGNIVYDHIGEGAYEETEMKIQELLTQRAEVLGLETDTSDMSLATDSIESTLSTNRNKTPELYLGTNREEYRVESTENIPLHHYAFEGDVVFEDEFVRTDGELILHFRAQDVHTVVEASEPVTADLYLDGEFFREHAFHGSDLSTLIELDQAEQHILKIDFHDQVDVYTFTFG